MEREFRIRGSVRKYPRGGNVADTPFARSLHEVMVTNGYETQTEFSIASCGRISNVTLSDWITGRSIPGPFSFGTLLEVLKPNEDQRARLVEPWVVHFQGKRRRREVRPERHYKRSIRLTDVEKALIIVKRKNSGPPDGFKQSFVAELFKVSRQRINQIKQEKGLGKRLSLDDVLVVARSLKVRVEQ